MPHLPKQLFKQLGVHSWSFAWAFVAGVWLLQQQASLLSVQLLWGMALGLPLAMLLALKLSQRSASAHQHNTVNAPASQWMIVWLWIMMATLAACIGFGFAGVRAHERMSVQLDTKLEGQDLWLTGVVDSLPAVTDNSQRFYFQLDADSTYQGRIPERLYLSWFGSNSFAGSSKDAQGALVPIVWVKPGERWRLQVRLRQPHGTLNPYVFDYESWLLQENLRATGTVRPRATPQRLDEFVWSLQAVIDRARMHLRQSIVQALPSQRYASVMAALVMGDQRAIVQDDWQVFNATGIGHLISISGLHITMLAAMAGTCALVLWRWLVLRSFLPAFTRRVSAQTLSLAVAASMALGYALLAGWGVPARRTALMVLIACLVWLIRRQARPVQVLSLALFAVVMFDPWAVLSAGFWLSFVAVGLIFYVAVGRAIHDLSPALSPDETMLMPTGAADSSTWQQAVPAQTWRHIKTSLHQAGRIQWAMTIGLAPLTIAFFSQFSVVGPVANAIAIPIVSFIVTPVAIAGALLNALGLSGLPLWLAHSVFEGMMWLITWLAALPIASISFAKPSSAAFVLSVVAVVWLLAPNQWPGRALALLLFLPLLILRPTLPAKGQLWVTALDVGQGTAVLVQTAGFNLLYDTGASYGKQADAGSRIIVPHLRGLGISVLDAVVVSHDDKDHSGGAASVLKGMQVKRFITGLRATHPLTQWPGHEACTAGQRWQVNGAQFEFIWPLPGYVDETTKTNARSCVLKVTVGQQSVLLTGDIESDVESALLANTADQLASTVLVVPHHGSKTSSSSAFLETVKPTISLIQAGYRNAFGHPHPAVLERYQSSGLAVQSTAMNGAIQIKLSQTDASLRQNPIQMHMARDLLKRYWHHVQHGALSAAPVQRTELPANSVVIEPDLSGQALPLLQ